MVKPSVPVCRLDIIPFPAIGKPCSQTTRPIGTVPVGSCESRIEKVAPGTNNGKTSAKDFTLRNNPPASGSAEPVIVKQCDKGTRPGRNRCQPCPAISCQGWAGCRLRKKAPGPATSGRHPLPDTGVDRVPYHAFFRRYSVRSSSVASTIRRHRASLGGTAPTLDVRTIEPLRTTSAMVPSQLLDKSRIVMDSNRASGVTLHERDDFMPIDRFG